MLNLCRELGITFVAYSPLGRGMLSGALNNISQLPENARRRTQPRFSQENFVRNQNIVIRIAELARNKGCTTAQLTISWIMNKGHHIVPIPGTKHRAYLEETAGALEITFSPAEMARIESIIPPDAAIGSRYPESAMRAVGR